VLPVLAMGPEEEWKRTLDAAFDTALAAVDGDDFTAVAAVLVLQHITIMLAILHKELLIQ
jgi:hypothetical protein